MDERALRRRSKALLGLEYRLEIAAAIDGCHGETFTTQSIASTTGIFYPRVQEDLQRLLRAGLIHVVEKGRDVRYQAVETTYWDARHDSFESRRATLSRTRGLTQVQRLPDLGRRAAHDTLADQKAEDVALGTCRC